MQFKYQIIITICMLIVQFNFAQKTDIVRLYNGDRITGEIKRLEVGILVLKTDDLETVNIKWERVKNIETEKIYEIELENGSLYYGSIWPGKIDRILIVKSLNNEHTLFKRFIVKITQIRETFWDRLDGYIKLGASFTKANSVGQLSFGLNGNYRTREFYAELNANSAVTTIKNEQTSRKEDLFINYLRFLEDKWFWGAILGAEENTQLGIRLRTSIGGGVGNYFLKTNVNWLYGLAGLVLNREWFINSTEARYNLEALITGDYLLFIYEHPKVNLKSTLNIYPGLSDFGRVRTNIDVSLDWEIFLDFFWELSFYVSHDNKPVSNASHTDYRFQSSFKYEL